MTRTIAHELAFAVAEAEAAGSPEAAAARVGATALPLALRVGFAAGRPRRARGRRATASTSPRRRSPRRSPSEIDRPIALDVATDPRSAHVAIGTEHGVLEATVPRDRLSVSNPHQLLVLMVFDLDRAGRDRGDLPAQPGPADPGARRGGRGLRQGPLARRSGRPAPRRCAAPGSPSVAMRVAHRAADRAAHADAVGRQPRPADAADPDEADAGADGRDRRDPRPDAGRRPDGADARRVPRLRPRRQPRGDGAGRPVRARRRRRRGRPPHRRLGRARAGRRERRRPGAAAAAGGRPRAAEPRRQCRAPRQPRRC